jgi:hypothetical protein
VSTRILTQALYGLFGAGYLIAGTAACLYRTGLLPDVVRDALVAVSRGDANTLHVVQEFGTHLILAGLVTLWFLRHYEQSRPFHWFMTVCWGLFALIHWFDVRGPYPSAAGPLVNTVPFALFAVTGLLRLRCKR